MRFDDIIVGTLMNRLRFNVLFYDSFVELVRLGAIVPALDGFEEMFVEGSSGDAISALGNLMQAMQSSGAAVIAARKAYFQFKNLRAQTRLLDSMSVNRFLSPALGFAVGMNHSSWSMLANGKFLMLKEYTIRYQINSRKSTHSSPERYLLSDFSMLLKEGDERLSLLARKKQTRPTIFANSLVPLSNEKRQGNGSTNLASQHIRCYRGRALRAFIRNCS